MYILFFVVHVCPSSLYWYTFSIGLSHILIANSLPMFVFCSLSLSLSLHISSFDFNERYTLIAHLQLFFFLLLQLYVCCYNHAIMMEDLMRSGTKVLGSNRRLSMVTILLSTIAFLLVITSVIAFLYVTRKGLFSKINFQVE